MNKFLATALISMALAMSLPAKAHTEAYFDSIKAPHGGQMRMAGPYHLELVTQDKEITLYVADHSDKKISTEGGVGKVSFQVGKAKPTESIKLEPAGDNTFKGTGDFTLTPDTVVIVFLKLPEAEAQSARFTPLKQKAKSEKKATETKKPASGHDHHNHHMHH
ncbi:MAG TPA: hypothetical protein VHB01_00505 [Nitrosospira sp.]|nr:hypothetical protein [Nitrosospira sp.]